MQSSRLSARMNFFHMTIPVFAVLCALVMLCPGRVGCEIIHVDCQGGGDYLTIQEGIDAASEGDTVLVAPGDYEENIIFPGGEILLASYFILDGEESHVRSTVIDGTHSGTVVTFSGGESGGDRIVGFTIRNGSCTLYGGGIRCGENSSPVISDNIITQCQAGNGGGISCRYCSARILRNVIENNFNVSSGGGIYCQGNSTPLIKNNLISGNKAAWGGGIFVEDCSAEIVKNLLVENQAVGMGNQGGEGGGILCSVDATGVIRNNTVVCNSATAFTGQARGGGVFVDSGTGILFDSNIVVLNGAADEGGGIYCREAGYIRIIYNDLFDNSPENYYGCGPGTGDISEDPLFVGGDLYDYHLQEDSPCIDSGNPGLRDPDLSRRDMGCYFYRHRPPLHGTLPF